MSFERKCKRNKLRNRIGGKNMQSAWRSYQIHRYGYDAWRSMRIANDPKNRTSLGEV